jgi:hypothetical protein
MHRIWMGLGFAISLTAAAEALQAQTSPQQPANPAASSAAITVSGCVQPSTAVGSGSAGGSSAAANSAPPAHFVLMQPSTAPPPAQAAAPGTPTSAAGVTGAGAAPGAAPVGTSGSIVPVSHYILHGRDGELAKYAGQRVEIIGTSSQAAPAAAAAPERSPDTTTQVIPHEPQRGPVSTAPATDAPAAGGPATAHPSVQHLTVQSVRMLAATCP